MRKMLVVLGLGALLLGVLGGAAVAAADTGDDDVSPTVVQAQMRDRVQDRVQDPLECGTCTRLDGDATAIQETTQLRSQLRVHDPEECDGDGAQVRAQVQEHARAEVQSQEGDGVAGGYGTGPQDGTGPLHEGTGDGSGHQYGQQGR